MNHLCRELNYLQENIYKIKNCSNILENKTVRSEFFNKLLNVFKILKAILIGVF